MSTLSLRRNPVRLVLSRSTWAAAWYLFAYLFTGTVLFAIALTAAITGAVLGITLAGIPVLVAASATIRWCADVERVRLRTVDPAPIAGRYREVTGSGVMAQLRTRWRDPANWRDIAYLLGMYVPLLALDLIVFAVWLTFLAGITLPIWYWAPWQEVHGVRYHGYQIGYFPNGPHGRPGYGLYVDTLPKALLAAAVCVVLFLLFNYVLVATARLHAAVARGLLGPQEDPLREAKEVLRRPGPLQRPTQEEEVIPNGR
jgi:Putative sensor